MFDMKKWTFEPEKADLLSMWGGSSEPPETPLATGMLEVCELYLYTETDLSISVNSDILYSWPVIPIFIYLMIQACIICF